MKPLHQIIKRPLITEKSNLQREAGQTVTFEVPRTLTRSRLSRPSNWPSRSRSKMFAPWLRLVRPNVLVVLSANVRQSRKPMSPSPREPSISSASKRV